MPPLDLQNQNCVVFLSIPDVTRSHSDFSGGISYRIKTAGFVEYKPENMFIDEDWTEPTEPAPRGSVWTSATSAPLILILTRSAGGSVGVCQTALDARHQQSNGGIVHMESVFIYFCANLRGEISSEGKVFPDSNV